MHHRLKGTLSVLSVCMLLSLPAGADDLQWLAGGHAGDISAVAYSPDGQVVASASDDSTVKLWSTNGILIRTLSVHPCQATALAFSPDGTKLAVGAYHGPTFNEGRGTVTVWQSPDGWQPSSSISLLHVTTSHLGKVNALAFSSDSTRLASGGAEGSNVVQQVSNGATLRRLAAYDTSVGPAAVHSLAFSAGGLLASGCEDHTIRLWDSSWNQVWNNTSGHASNVTAVVFSPDESMLVSGSLDGSIKLWSTSGGSLIRTLAGHTEGVSAVAFSSTGATLGSGSYDHTARLWNVSDGSGLATLTGHSDPVTAAGFSPDGNAFVTGSWDNSVRIWSVTTGSLVRELCPPTDSVRVIACAPDGQSLATVSNDRKINLRRVSDGALLHSLEGHTNWISAIAFSPDGQTLVSAGDADGGSLILWQVDDGALLRRIDAGGNGSTSVAFSPDGSLLASGGDATDQTIQLWDPASGLLLQTLDGHTNGVTALAFAPSGGLLASAGRRFDNVVKLWDPATGTLVNTYAGVSNNVECLAFSPDGDTIAAAGNGNGLIQLWDVESGTRQTFGTGTRPVYSLMFSPDGGSLASGGDDQINFWNVASGTLSQVWTQEAVRVSCFAYSPNGNLLAYGRDDATTVLAPNPWSVLGQPPLLFSGIGIQGDGTALIEADCQPGTRYLIQASDNLQDWTYLDITTSETNWLQLIDPVAIPESRRFYRALTLP